MGRKAKNKQGAPNPGELDALISGKKLGKRKATDENDAPPAAVERPAKRSKDASVKKQKKGKSTKKPLKAAGSKASQKKKVEEAGSGSEGWEDVEDGEGLDDNLKCVLSLSLSHTCGLISHKVSLTQMRMFKLGPLKTLRMSSKTSACSFPILELQTNRELQ